MDRRQALLHIGTAAAGALGCSQPRVWKSTEPPPEGIEELAERIRIVDRDQAFALATASIRATTSWQEFLGAIMLAGARDIRPRPHGILHTVMMVEATFQLADRASTPREAWHSVLYHLHNLKTSQTRDVREDSDYAMAPLVPAHEPSADEARREFVAAMQAFDTQRAENAVQLLRPHIARDEFFELFRPFSVRCYAFIGHKAIFAAHAERALSRIEWRHAEPVLRSLVVSSLVDRNTDSYDRVRKLTAQLPDGWLRQASTARQSTALAQALRQAKPEQAGNLVLEHLRNGLGPDGAWDAIIEVGNELFEHRPGRRAADGRNSLLPVHALTVPNAMRSSFLQSKDQTAQGLLLLQAGNWVTALREDLARMVQLSVRPKREQRSENAPSLEAAFTTGNPRVLESLLRADSTLIGPAIDRLRRSLLRVGQEHHQHKFAAAMIEESGRCRKQLRPRLVASALDYLANLQDSESAIHKRATRALDEAGLK